MADILQMHDLKPAPGAKKDRTRVGRGEGSKGKTSGRGDKGTRSVTRFVRASKVASCRCTCAFRSCVASRARSRRNIRSSTLLLSRNCSRRMAKSPLPIWSPRVPCVTATRSRSGDGEVSAAYTIKGVKASASAKSKIEAAGGSISED